MQGPHFVAGATVYDTAGAKVGTLRAYNPQGGYLLVEKGWLFPKDLYIPLAAVQGTDATGAVHLGLRKDDLQDDRYAIPPVGRPTVAGGDGQNTTTHADEETITIPIHEGDIIVGRQEEEQGRVRLHKEVVQEHETVSVSLEQERDLEMPVMGEEAAVGKQTRATKEVRVRKEDVTETESVSGTVRKERVTVEADPDELRADDTGTPQTRNRKRH
jgi:stress response protein YsnF